MSAVDRPNEASIVFVYGTLLAGEVNAHYLRTAQFLGVDAIAQAQLFDAGPYPYLRSGQSLVYGECYAVDEPTLAALDRLEEHPQVYCRTEHTLISGRHAWVYVGQAEAIEQLPAILSGRWRWRQEPLDCRKGIFVYGSKLDLERLAARAPNWDDQGEVMVVPDFACISFKHSEGLGVVTTLWPQAGACTEGIILAEPDRVELYAGIDSEPPHYLRQTITGRDRNQRLIQVETYIAHPSRLVTPQASDPVYRLSSSTVIDFD